MSATLQAPTRTRELTRRLPPGLRPKRGRSWVIWLVPVGAFVVIIAPVALFAGAGNPPCASSLGPGTPVPSGPHPAGMFAAPLQLEPGRWYQVGATEYGDPGSGSGSYGAIGNPAESYLPAHPDSFAELSVLDRNPANSGSFTFADANALNTLPYLTGLRVASDGSQKVLYKRDVGYGQGPGQQIANGQPYRLDLWWESARALGVSKSPVSIELAPASGTGGTLGVLPSSEPPPTSAGQCLGAGTLGPLQLTPASRRGSSPPVVPRLRRQLQPG